MIAFPDQTYFLTLEPPFSRCVVDVFDEPRPGGENIHVACNMSEFALRVEGGLCGCLPRHFGSREQATRCCVSTDFVTGGGWVGGGQVTPTDTASVGAGGRVSEVDFTHCHPPGR